MITNTIELRANAQKLLDDIHNLEIRNESAKQSRENLMNTINNLKEKVKNDKEALDIATHAIEILRQVSDEAVTKAYAFLEKSLNAALERMFANTVRKIRIKEYTRNNQYPQLELELEVGNGKKRSLKTDSGHGLAQIVSLLSILSLIVITNSRRILIMDEVISGLSVHNRKVVADIMWSFTEIGFQFIVNDHGFVPEHSQVYHLEMVGDVSHVKQSYIATKGVYLQGGSNSSYDYSQHANEMVSNPSSSKAFEEIELTESDEVDNIEPIEQTTVQNNQSVVNQAPVIGNNEGVTVLSI